MYIVQSVQTFTINDFTFYSDNCHTTILEASFRLLHLGGECPHSNISTDCIYTGVLHSCMNWLQEHLVSMQETKSDVKLNEISAAISVHLQLLCNCSLSVQRHFFSCLGTTDSQTVVFLAELSYTALPGVDIPSLLTSWVASTPHIIVASEQLQMDATCLVVIDSLEPESCTVAPPTDLQPTSIIVAAVAACATVFLVLAIIVVLVISVVVCYKRRSKYRYVPLAPAATTYNISDP